MAYAWIKLIISIIDDYDVEMLPDRMFKLFIQFQHVACKYNHDGLLESIPDLSWRKHLMAG